MFNFEDYEFGNPDRHRVDVAQLLPGLSPLLWGIARSRILSPGTGGLFAVLGGVENDEKLGGIIPLSKP